MTDHPCLPTAGRCLGDQSAARCWDQAKTGDIPAKKFSGSRLHFLRARTKFANCFCIYNVHPADTQPPWRPQRLRARRSSPSGRRSLPRVRAVHQVYSEPGGVFADRTLQTLTPRPTALWMRETTARRKRAKMPQAQSIMSPLGMPSSPFVAHTFPIFLLILFVQEIQTSPKRTTCPRAQV